MFLFIEKNVYKVNREMEQDTGYLVQKYKKNTLVSFPTSHSKHVNQSLNTYVL